MGFRSKQPSEFLNNMAGGKSYYITLSHPGTKDGKAIGFIEDQRILRAEIAHYAAFNEVPVVLVSFSRSIVADTDATLAFEVSQSFNLKTEKVY